MDINNIKVPDSISNEDLNPIALEYSRAGGRMDDLPAVIGISRERVKEYTDWLWAKMQPRYPDRRYPIQFPKTSRTCYVSFKAALNLRLPGELTGDWHYHASFFGYSKTTFVPLAGRTGLVNTVPALGSLGVRDMGREISDCGIKPYDGPVWVANHYRAIADTVLHNMLGPWPYDVLPAGQIARWLCSEDDFEIIVEDYLKPLRRFVPRKFREIFDEWLPLVGPNATYRSRPRRWSTSA